MYSLNKVSYKVLDTVPGIQQAMNTFNDYYYCCFIIPLWAHALGVLWLTQWWLKCIRACRLLSGLGLASFSTLTFHWFSSLLVTLHLNWPSSISLHMLNSFFPAVFSLGHLLLLTRLHTLSIRASFQRHVSLSCLTFPSIPSPKEVFLDHSF